MQRAQRFHLTIMTVDGTILFQLDWVKKTMQTVQSHVLFKPDCLKKKG